MNKRLTAIRHLATMCPMPASIIYIVAVLIAAYWGLDVVIY